MGPEEGKRSEKRTEINRRNSLCLQPFRVRANERPCSYFVPENRNKTNAFWVERERERERALIFKDKGIRQKPSLTICPC